MSIKKIPTVSFFEVLKNAARILKNPLPFHKENFEKHGDIFKVNLAPNRSVIFTRDPGLAKHILQKNHRSYHKSTLQSKDLRKYVGEGLLTANGDKWLQQRRLVQPAFHRKKLEAIITTIHEVIKEELSQIKDQDTIEVFPLMSDLAFNVVAKSLFSYTDTGDTVVRLQYITKEVQKTLIKEIRQPYKRWWFTIKGDIKKTLKLSKEARAILHTIIEERKKSDQKYNDLLDMLLEARYEDGSGMDNEQLIDEILILFIAGYETTSNALTFTCMLLAKNPEIQDKVYQEVSALDFGAIQPMDQIAGLQYTKQCIEETMRLYPPAYFSDRTAIKEDCYKDIVFQKGATILISFFEIHKHTDIWKDPSVFNPDRFDPKIDKKEYSDGYFPFGAGPRMCVGNNFALYEMVLTISELVKSYKLLPAFDTIQIQPLITLKPVNSYVKLEKRV